MRKVICLFLALLLMSAGVAYGSRGLNIETKKGTKVGGYSGSYALLVGVSKYETWPTLNSIPYELSQVETTLTKRGFTVVKVMNPDSRALENAFENFINKYGYSVDNRLLFYFAGHGFTRKNGSKGYLVPVDSPLPKHDREGFLRTALPMSQIKAWSRDMESKHALFLFDSCFSGTIFKTRALPETPPYISRATAEPVRQFITAGDAGETVPAKSVFTPVFIDALRYGYGDLNKDGYISGSELGMHLQSMVARYSSQNPQYGKIDDYDLARGDFIFKADVEQENKLLFGGAGAAPAAPSAQTASLTQPPSGANAGAMGALRIESQPAGADIIINGNRVGQTPMTLSALPTGRVTIHVEKDGYKGQDMTTSVLGGYTQYVGFALKEGGPPARAAKAGQLFVMPEPGDARIRVLNIGPKYKKGMKLAPGRYHVEVSKPGYVKDIQWVELGEDQVLQVPVTLEKKSASNTMVAAIPVPTMGAGAGTSAPKVGGPTPGKPWKEPTTGMQFVWVRGGCYDMGSNGGERDEQPVHKVCLDGFWMSKYEVTNAQYRKFKQTFRPKLNRGGSLNDDRQPAVHLSWKSAKAYAKWMTSLGGGVYRLPTEAEWEYAARGGSSAKRYWGDDDGAAVMYANVNDKTSQRVNNFAWPSFNGDDGHAVTAPIGSFKPNKFGLYDMIGNAWEWCEDVYKSSAYSRHAKQNPLNTGRGDLRVIRGGSWSTSPKYVRTTERYWFHEENNRGDLGFRLVLLK